MPPVEDDNLSMTETDRRWLLMTLMVTQTCGWGTGLTLLGVLAKPIGDELQLSSGLIFSAAIVLYGTAAMVAPYAGRLADRFGGTRLLAPGAACASLSLVLLAIAEGPISYLSAWLVQGIAFHFMLMTACYTAISQIWGLSAPRVIGLVTLATGLCATIFWPLTDAFLRIMDWRTVCLVYAGFTLAVIVPINLVLAHATRRLRPIRGSKLETEPPIAGGKAQHGLLFLLLAGVFGLSAAIGNSVGLLMIDIFSGMGLARAEAVYAASLVGIAFLISRALAIMSKDAIRPLPQSLLVFGLLTLPFLLLLLWRVIDIALPFWLAVLAAFLYGIPQGLSSILRPALVQALFGNAHFGAIVGRLHRVSDAASAVTPSILAAVLGWSLDAALILSLAMAIGSVVFILGLCRLTRDQASI